MEDCLTRHRQVIIRLSRKVVIKSYSSYFYPTRLIRTVLLFQLAEQRNGFPVKA